jgi:hypothetical protein
VPLSLPPSSGLALHLAAWEPNGNEGAGIESGAYMSAWKNRGSGVADASQATRTHQPQWKAARNRWPAVQFDGVSDRLDIPSSDSTLKFIHETGVFDIFLTLRGGVNKYGAVIGNSFNVGDLGFYVERVHNVAGAPLTFYLFLGPGTYRSIATSTYFVPTAPSFEPGRANKLLFRAAGVGSRLQASGDFSLFYSTTGGGAGAVLPTLSVGNATLVTQVGAAGSNYFFGGEILDVAIYNRNLSAGELTTMGTYLSERYGV